VILVESSAWIEYLRGTGSPANVEVRRLLDADIGVTEAVVMEVLAGARGEGHLAGVRGLLARAHILPCEWTDWLYAVHLYRQCRAGGETVRGLLDCLIGAVAIRHDVPVLHHDRDFDVLARHTGLTVHQPG